LRTRKKSTPKFDLQYQIVLAAFVLGGRTAYRAADLRIVSDTTFANVFNPHPARCATQVSNICRSLIKRGYVRIHHREDRQWQTRHGDVYKYSGLVFALTESGIAYALSVIDATTLDTQFKHLRMDKFKRTVDVDWPFFGWSVGWSVEDGTEDETGDDNEAFD
jgi:hypothetical protein